MFRLVKLLQTASVPTGRLPTARDLIRFAVCPNCNEENVGHFNFCFNCGVPSADSTKPLTVPGLPVTINRAQLVARRTQAETVMRGRANQVRKGVVAGQFDSFLMSYSGGARGWLNAVPDDVVDWFCFLDSQGRGNTLVHEDACPGVGSSSRDRCRQGAKCAKRYAADSLRKGYFSKLKMAYKEQLGRGDEWNPVSRTGNPCSNPTVETYLTFTSEEQKRVGVTIHQAAPLLEDTLGELLRHMRLRAQAAETVRERIIITRDVALFSLELYSMRRGSDLSFTLASQIIRLPEGKGFIFNFLFGKTLRASSEAVVVLAFDDRDICAVRGVAEYIQAAQDIGWDLSTGYLFSEPEQDGSRGTPRLLAKDMTAALKSHLQAANLPVVFSMHSFRVGGSLSRAMAGETIEQIMKVGGWKTESIARYYVEPSSKKKRARTYNAANDAPLSSAFKADFAACIRR